ncbi:MAG TPA: type I secretion system permease/ATPase [Paenirhodobacter sp.]
MGIFINLLYLALPLYHAQVFDRVIPAASLDTLVALTAIVLPLLMALAGLDFLRAQMFGILGRRLAVRLGPPAFAAAVESALRLGPGSAAHVLRDVNHLRDWIAGGRIVLPIDLIFVPVMLAVLWLLNPAYAWVALAGSVWLTLVAVITERAVRRPMAHALRAEGVTIAETRDALDNSEVIAAMGMLPALSARWQQGQHDALSRGHAGQSIARALTAVARGSRLMMQVAMIGTGAALISTQQVSPGSLLAAMVIAGRLFAPFEQMIDGWRQWVGASAAIARLTEVLRNGQNTRSTTPLPVVHADLAAESLGHIPSGLDRPILHDLNFRIAPGEMLGVIGASGAGKSTLARLVTGLVPPTQGGIFLDGQSTFLHERTSFGTAVGYLPQDPQLFAGTVRDNIARFRDAPIEDIITAARQTGVHDLIGRLPQGYDTPLAASGAPLSGGQRQRIALARALFGAPKLLVLDEPNASLDADGEAALIAAIETARGRGAAVLVIAQRMSILRKADRLLVLHEGRARHYGPRAQVLAALAPQGTAHARQVRR